MQQKDRQRELLIFLRREAGASVATLAGYFHVSRMTIHRDLQYLKGQGALQRIHGGAVTKSAEGSTAPDENCICCARPVLPHQKTLFAEPLSVSVCCVTCGLRYQYQQGSHIAIMTVADYLSGKLLPASDAFYLINSLAVPCCAPSILSFAVEAEVSLFQDGFGGSIARFDEAVTFLNLADGIVAD